MHYKARWKVQRTLECNLLVVTSMHIILCQVRIDFYMTTAGQEIAAFQFQRRKGTRMGTGVFN